MSMSLTARLRRYSGMRSIGRDTASLLLNAANEIDRMGTAIQEAIKFLNRIEGDGYGGESEFENARRSLQTCLVPRHDIEAQVRRLGSDSLLPDWQP